MKNDQYTFEWIRSLQDEIQELKKRGPRRSDTFDLIEAKKEKLLSLCQTYEDGHILLKGYPDLLERMTPVEPASKGVLPCREGTRWEDCWFTLASEETAKIRTPQGECAYNYDQLKLSDRRKGLKPSNRQPTDLWKLLRLFAKTQGFFNYGNIGEQTKRNMVKNVSRLDKHMQKIFGIHESMLDGNYKKSKGPGKGKGYQTKLRFSDATQVAKSRAELGEIEQEFDEAQQLRGKKSAVWSDDINDD